MGCDDGVLKRHPGRKGFQSTHPVWGATWVYPLLEAGQQQFQSTHPVWGATALCDVMDWNYEISIHAPRVGCDIRPDRPKREKMNFNPRTPCGVRQVWGQVVDTFLRISIHAPRVGCDANGTTTPSTTSYFNPRTPCGVRPRTSST